MMKLAVTAALLSLATAAQAEDIQLNTPMAATTMIDGPVDMTVYFMEADAGFDVTAHYLARHDSAETNRLQMTLADGDSVHFGLPGHAGTLYTFARDGETVKVSHARTWQQLARN
ncbi:hypothetical protein SAMN05421688_0812 [Poseidonocella pacifica]|uniref:Uncharacterized protein n=1 Tax=Poseidonocella pacifica TaxID=871651 RepID=A0A1I0VQD8_9RHOB|nr:hypothetical protein [Poseidonocella pacifica]SFA77886.1 hypothetical protein SAMN05421688_0812 [Poseidonocella pacifica]